MALTAVQTAAIERINRDFDPKKVKGRFAPLICNEVKDRVIEFCRQNEEFADFVLADSRDINESCSAVESAQYTECANDQKCESYQISDILAYAAAAKFYVPTIKIHMTMTLDMAGDAKAMAGESEPLPKSDKPDITVTKNESVKKLDLSFDDLFGGL